MKIKNLIKNTVLIVMCLTLLIPILIYVFPFLVGANSSYTIMGGSMNPALKFGDIIIVKEDESLAINVGDMVTVKPDEFIYTHRVVERLEGDLFRLKGDANEDPDQNLVEASQIIGRVILVFPFSQLYTPYGFTSALLLPAILIIGKQGYNVYQFTNKRNKREKMKWRRKSHKIITLDTSTLLLALILTVSTTRIIAPQFISGTSSYFSDIEWMTFLFSAGTWIPEFHAEGYGCIGSLLCPCTLECGEGILCGDGDIIALRIEDESKSWKITDYQTRIGLREEVLEVLEHFEQRQWYETMVGEMGDPAEWPVETYTGESDGETLKVRIFNHRYVFSYSRGEVLFTSFFIGVIVD
jgi:signal peptidase